MGLVHLTFDSCISIVIVFLFEFDFGPTACKRIVLTMKQGYVSRNLEGVVAIGCMEASSLSL